MRVFGGRRLNRRFGRSAVAAAALLVLAACGPGGGCAPAPPSNNGALIVGHWLGSGEVCPGDLIDYTFNSNGTFIIYGDQPDNGVCADPGSGEFLAEGTYGIVGNTLDFHYTLSPECPVVVACPPDTQETIGFLNSNVLLQDGATFSRVPYLF
jgi:hypothetical protein